MKRKLILLLCLMFTLSSCNGRKVEDNISKVANNEKVKEEGLLKLDRENQLITGIYIEKSKNLIDDVKISFYNKLVDLDKMNYKIEDINLQLKDIQEIKLGENTVFYVDFKYKESYVDENKVSFYKLENKELKKLNLIVNEKEMTSLNSIETKYEDGKLVLKYYDAFTGNKENIVESKYNLKLENDNIVLEKEISTNVQHNLDEVEKLMKKDFYSLTIGMYNFEHQKETMTKAGMEYKERFMGSLNSVMADKIFDKNNNPTTDVHGGIDNFYVISLYSISNIYSSYNDKTYTLKELYEGIKKSNEEFGMFEIVELDDSFENYDKNKVREMVQFDFKNPNSKPKLIYFKNDKNFVFSVYPGAGGIGVKHAPKDTWKIEGDRITINFYKFDSDVISDNFVVLRLNSKDYPYKDKKSKYYVEKFEVGNGR